jgi:hypothetical protein
MGLFLLFCSLKSIARRSARPPRRGDLLSMIEEAMIITAIVFVLIILLFGFDSTGEVKTRRQHIHG